MREFDSYSNAEPSFPRRTGERAQLEDETLRDLVAEGTTFLKVLEYLSRRDSHPLTPLGFLRIFQEELGISFIESRNMLEYFDPHMQPIVDKALINERGRLLLQQFTPRN
ncbi:hypothetical protein BIV25_05885 [Streptomyces sp. MUSC 14]|uniref:hypothetical protein n=1 Tax=Streptomyces sp. MUSC 14 TaxID=1354889 RepID=UPI0008F56F2F|nr:hypothetical protein [Streptomyces sp. MUSC 14]OIK01340.1 hypothetical protein BIV25_05885 [Streptomyces sp. MUSC 14]